MSTARLALWMHVTALTPLDRILRGAIALLGLMNSNAKTEDQFPSEPAAQDRDKQSDHGDGSCKRGRPARIAETQEQTRQEHHECHDIRQTVNGSYAARSCTHGQSLPIHKADSPRYQSAKHTGNHQPKRETPPGWIVNNVVHEVRKDRCRQQPQW